MLVAAFHDVGVICQHEGCQGPGTITTRGSPISGGELTITVQATVNSKSE